MCAIRTFSEAITHKTIQNTPPTPIVFIYDEFFFCYFSFFFLRFYFDDCRVVQNHSDFFDI